MLRHLFIGLVFLSIHAYGTIKDLIDEALAAHCPRVGTATDPCLIVVVGDMELDLSVAIVNAAKDQFKVKVIGTAYEKEPLDIIKDAFEENAAIITGAGGVVFSGIDCADLTSLHLEAKSVDLGYAVGLDGSGVVSREALNIAAAKGMKAYLKDEAEFIIGAWGEKASAQTEIARSCDGIVAEGFTNPFFGYGTRGDDDFVKFHFTKTAFAAEDNNRAKNLYGRFNAGIGFEYFKPAHLFLLLENNERKSFRKKAMKFRK